ncbi:MAG: TRCF domain-containing protein, partial [Thermodesulfobacteriota bacterium]|nr:TRCF domain-containing protein [Thermodesulfobacteriota bacterium]
RVGRGDEQAYAYLFIPQESSLTRDAQKRLKVLMEHSDLGSGFQIAMSDLQIRGGGTILGPTQSGQIASVGYEMYLQLMERAMSEVKGEPVEPELEPEIQWQRSAYIPEAYVSDIDQRMTAYRRLARINDTSELKRLRQELRDRFGPLPEEADALLEKVLLKVVCKNLGIERLDIGPKGIVLAFCDRTCVKPEKIARLVQQDPQRFRLRPDHVLELGMSPGRSMDPVEVAKNLLQELA